MNAVIPHPIPDAALDGDIAIIGRKGAGKTWAARGMVERLLEAGRRVVVLDPLDSWWGLKARADGTPGFPVTVIGGDHADVALDVASGAALGAFIAKSQGAFVIDTSDLRRPDTVAFCAPFLAALYALNREPIWLVAEECDFYSPQGATREQAPLANELDQIARRGRARGFRLWTITQRPARIDKSLISQAGSLLAMKLIAPQDRRAVEDWLGSNVENGGDVADQLPQLPRGHGFFWNPDLGIAEHVVIPRIQTLDTSFTPSADSAPLSATLAKADVGALRKALGATSAPLSPEAIKAEAYAQGRAAGAREERARLRGILGTALESLQDGAEPVPATEVAAGAPEAAPAPPQAAPAGPRTNDEAQRAILAGLNAPQRRMVERVLERGTMTPDRLGNFTNMLGAQKAFRANLDALVEMNVLAFSGGLIAASDRLYPLGRTHR